MVEYLTLKKQCKNKKNKILVQNYSNCLISISLLYTKMQNIYIYICYIMMYNATKCYKNDIQLCKMLYNVIKCNKMLCNYSNCLIYISLMLFSFFGRARTRELHQRVGLERPRSTHDDIVKRWK